MPSCMMVEHPSREISSCYIIIEEINDTNGRAVIYTGSGNISVWKEKLNREPNALRYDITQFLIVIDKKRPQFEISNFQLRKTDNYQSLASVKTSVVPFDTTTRTFLEEIISVKKGKGE